MELSAAAGVRRGDLISPFSTCLVLLTAIYGIRPLFMLASDQFSFYGLTISPEGFDQAALIGLLGVTSLCLGYLGHRKMTRPVAPRPLVEDRGGIGLTVVAAVAVLVAWFVVTAFIGGGADFVADTFDGRGNSSNRCGVHRCPAVASALPVVAGLLVAVRRIVIERTPPVAVPRECPVLVSRRSSDHSAISLGGRRFLIPTVIAALTGVCARNWRTAVGVGMGLTSIAIAFALMVVPFVRSAGSRVGENKDLIGAMGDHVGSTGIGGVVSDFFLSYDTEMFSYVAYVSPLIDSGMMPLGYGRGTALEMALAILPSSMLPTQTWSNSMLDSIFGRTCAEGVCPVPSAFGTLYFDLWFPGLVLGCILIGWLCAGYGRASA